jgi:hypothetical protein
MKLLSRRVLEELIALQATMEGLARDRNAALRMFITSRESTTYVAQQEFWLEFSWLDQEYRMAVRRLARFCLEHRDDSSTPVWSTQ